MAPIKEKLAWVPNLFTLGNLSMGFLAILISSSEHGNMELLFIASLLILLAVLFDGLDGFAARLLDANSTLGAQLDSLADLITFGVAPATLMYSFKLSKMNYALSANLYIPLGMLIALVWPACTAYRLARFNVEKKDDSFKGLPSPVAGLLVALMPLIFSDEPASIGIIDLVLTLLYIFCAFLMVSTLRYAKPQVTFLRRFSSGRLSIALCFITLILIFIGWRYGLFYTALSLFTITLLYLVTGLVSLLIHSIQKYRL